jgi:hypothetical protein
LIGVTRGVSRTPTEVVRGLAGVAEVEADAFVGEAGAFAIPVAEEIRCIVGGEGRCREKPSRAVKRRTADDVFERRGISIADSNKKCGVDFPEVFAAMLSDRYEIEAYCLRRCAPMDVQPGFASPRAGLRRNDEIDISRE